MQYLKIKRVKSQVRANGTAYVVPLIIKKNKKFGKVTSEKVVSKKKPVIVTGGHDSGKTYWLSRLFNEHKAIWSKYQDDGLFLDSIRPLSAWSDSACVVSWWTKKQIEDDDLPPWSKLKVWERQEKIADYLSESKAVLFIDNAHKLSGRKLQIVKDCIMVSNIFLITVSDEERLPPSIRHLVLRRKPQIIRLGTETAYDGTQAMVFIIALIALGAGWWEVSLVLGGLTALSKSKRSARQD
jgi:hypothetical protein